MFGYNISKCCCCEDFFDDFEDGWDSRWRNKSNYIGSWSIVDGKAVSTVAGLPGTANGQSNLVLVGSNGSGYVMTCDIEVTGTANIEIHGNYIVRLDGSTAKLYFYSGGSWQLHRTCTVGSGPYSVEINYNKPNFLSEISINGNPLWVYYSDVGSWPSFYGQMTLDNVRIVLQGEVRTLSYPNPLIKTCPKLQQSCAWWPVGDVDQITVTIANATGWGQNGCQTCANRIGTFVLDRISDCVYEYGPHSFGTCTATPTHIRVSPYFYDWQYRLSIQFGYYSSGAFVPVQTWDGQSYNVSGLCGNGALFSSTLSGNNFTDCFISNVTVTV